jgi:hypothetical protein
MSACLLLAAAMACIPSAGAGKEGLLSYETASAMRAQELAHRLLPPERAARVERAEVQQDARSDALSHIKLFHRPGPLGDRFCGQAADFVSFDAPEGSLAAAAGERAPMQAGEPREVLLIALAPGCRMAAGQAFAYLNPGVEPAAGQRVLEDLAAAKDAAAGPGPLPFSLRCEDTLGQGKCPGDGRSALAALPLEQAWLVSGGDGDPPSPRVTIGWRGSLYWDVAVRDFGTDKAEFSMVWKAPAPF